jgi:hypothetical protein
MAQKLKFGRGTWATKEGSTLAYNDENENYKPLPFNFERDSIATRVNKEGLIEVVGNDIPRIDYTDSAEGALLLENSSTNLITYSEDFSNSYWSKSGASVVDGFLSPSGNLSAFNLIEDSSNSTHGIAATAIQTTSNLTYISSIFVKKSERNWIYYRTNIGSSFAYQWFDLTNNIASSSIGTFDEAGVVEYSNDWVMCYVKKTETSGSGRQNQWFLSTDDLVQTYTGDGTSGVYIWGAMLEANSVASSYIPTSGSTVQRAAETANGSGNSEVFNDSEGVLFADTSAFVGAGGGTRRIEVSNAVNASQYVRLQIANGDGSLYAIVNNGSEQFLFNATSFNATLSNKIILKYKQNDFSLFLNGFEVGSSNVGNTFANGVLKQVNFSSTASEFYGKTKEIGYYDTALTDEELEYMTSYRSLNELVTELNLNTL